MRKTPMRKTPMGWWCDAAVYQSLMGAGVIEAQWVMRDGL
jgi:hypothetical protein